MSTLLVIECNDNISIESSRALSLSDFIRVARINRMPRTEFRGGVNGSTYSSDRASQRIEHRQTIISHEMRSSGVSTLPWVFVSEAVIASDTGGWVTWRSSKARSSVKKCGVSHLSINGAGARPPQRTRVTETLQKFTNQLSNSTQDFLLIF